MGYDGSDVDTKAIVLPSFEDFCKAKNPISHTHVLENNEHLDLKDIRIMLPIFKKQNINFIEILFTKYKFLNPEYEELFKPVLEAREAIARYNDFAAINCQVGMIYQKYKVTKINFIQMSQPISVMNINAQVGLCGYIGILMLMMLYD